MGSSAVRAARAERIAKTCFIQKSSNKSHLPSKVSLSDLASDRYECHGWEAFLDYVGNLDSYLNSIRASESDNPYALARLTPVELLTTFAARLEVEIPMLKLDIFESHRQAWSCLEHVYSKMKNTLLRHMLCNYPLKDERQLPLLVIDIFAIANGVDQPRMGLRDFLRFPSRMLRSKILKITGAIVQQFLKEENEKTKAARTVSMTSSRSQYMCQRTLFQS